MQCCVEDLSADQTGYLISFQVDEALIDESEFSNVEARINRNQQGFWSLIYRCKYEEEQHQFVNEYKRENSLLIKDEKVESILEYANDKLIISLYPTDLLFTHNWKRVKVV